MNQTIGYSEYFFLKIKRFLQKMGSLSLKLGCHILDCNFNTLPIIVFGVELVYIIFLERRIP